MIDRSENERRAALRLAYKRYRESPKGKARDARRLADPTVRERQRARSKTPHGKALARRKALLKRYGITVRQYDIMFALQDGLCVGCGRPPKTRRLAVEHDHKSKRVRGLACHNCNRYLIAKNTAETARWLVAYLSSEFDGRTL